MAGFGLVWDCTGPMYIVTATMSSYIKLTYGEIKSVLIWNFHMYWLAFIFNLMEL